MRASASVAMTAAFLFACVAVSRADDTDKIAAELSSVPACRLASGMEDQINIMKASVKDHQRVNVIAATWRLCHDDTQKRHLSEPTRKMAANFLGRACVVSSMLDTSDHRGTPKACE